MFGLRLAQINCDCRDNYPRTVIYKFIISLLRVNKSSKCERNMHVKGPLLVNGSDTCGQDPQLTAATPCGNRTIAHGNALKHVILCLYTYYDIPRQAIQYTMQCPPGHTIYHVMATRPYHM